MTEIPVGRSRARQRGHGGGAGLATTGAQPAASAVVPAQGGRAASRRGRAKPRRRVLRVLAWSTAGLVLVTGGGVAYLYEKYSGNIHSSPLFGGTSGDAGHEKPDAFGRTPINILVIGSDARDNPADCAIGGDCGPGANADVQMVLHVSADRSNATVMSIPRDVMTELPACTDTVHHTTMKAQRGQINSTLDYGPGCTVAAVHQLTQIPIDHFITVDFTGVVQMSDAVGGVPVCVSDNVYDPYSHLKLKKGEHTLKGMAALQFVRTRHGFGDGSDLGRAVAQHMFIGSMVRQLKGAGTLTNPGAVLSLADAATKALTVDTGLKGIPQLIGLADDLNKVPADRITFTTMQNDPDTLKGEDGRVLVAPAAKNLFSAIINDQSLTTSTGDKSSAAAQATGAGSDPAAASSPAAPATDPTAAGHPATSPAAGLPARDIELRVRNGSGAGGRANAVQQALVAKGFTSATIASNAPATERTTVEYPAGKQAQAQQVAQAIGLPADAVRPGEGTGLTLVIGADWTTGTGYTAPGAAPSAPAPVDTQAALSNSDAQTADDTSKCAQVSHDNTVALNGVGMTPVKAYDRSPDVPDSAP
ncbi:LCP family protein [Kitasatospora nipponensis]|uniref:LCP family protein n=1 Tax=Kitasatospora nipponensis TaxID=258049 RepID=A0ABN1VNF2_9ACTN